MNHLKVFLLCLAAGLPSTLLADVVDITGVVKDESGETLIGVTVKEKGSKAITVTDLDGVFHIKADPATAVLQVSHVGYNSMDVKVNGQNNLTITVKESSKLLDEVVVVGYGTQKRLEITGAVASLGHDDIKAVTSTNLTNTLQGKIPGLNIKQNTSEPGSYDNSFNVRGLGSPLIIVDGVPRDNFDRIDPNEIESVSVLKDASAAVYGVRAANGVILITTRKGSQGKTQVTLNASYGVQKITRFPKSVDAYGYMELYNEAMANRGETTPTYTPDLVTSGSPYANVNWFDEVVRKSAPQWQIGLTASGGTDRVQYFNSIGYMEEEGLWKAKSLKYQRYNIRSNVTAKLSDHITTEFQIGGFYDHKDAPAYYPAEILNAVGSQVPIYEVYANGNPDYLGYQYNDDKNALVKSSQNYSGYRRTSNYQIQATASIRWDIPWVKGLWAKALVAFDPWFHNDKQFKKQFKSYKYNEAADSYDVVTTSSLSNITEWRSNTSNTLTQLQINYSTKIKDAHNIQAMALMETRKWQNSELSGSRNTVMDAVDQIYAGLVDDARSVNGLADRNSNVGIVGRVDYDYKSKYLVEASFRVDGSSKFRNKRWGFFPSVSAGWRISEEKFFRNALPFVTNLKLRGSIGKLGDDNTDSYLWMMAFDYPGGDKYVLGDQGLIPGVNMPQIPNYAATWYTSTMKNIGIEMNLWNGALRFEADWFRRDRDGLLANRIVSVPGTFGDTFAKENLNSDMQTGFEIVLGTNGSVADFTYGVTANVTYTLSRNKYVESTTPGNSYDNWRHNTNDRNNNILWMYDYSGQFSSMEEIYSSPVLEGLYTKYSYLPGDLKYVDYNEDGIIDEWDKQPIRRGNMPVVNYGLTVSLGWRGFDLSATFQGAACFNARMESRPLQFGGSWDIFRDRWHKADPFDPEGEWIPGRYPSTRLQDPQNYGQQSTFFYSDCSYLRLKNLEIGYSLPRKCLDFLGIQDLRIYGNGFNLVTWCSKDLKYIDPENPGGSIERYPIMKNFNFGVNVTF